MWVGTSGSLGVDHSANASAVPISGYHLLATIAANTKRNAVTVQSQTTSNVQVVRSDGGSNVSTIMLTPATTNGLAGGSWSSQTFKGEVLVYSTNASDQVAAFED